MTSKDFNELAEKVLSRTGETLTRKHGEYSLDEDVLGVFKRAGELQHEKASKALLGMLAKHVVSIYDHVVDDIPMTDDMALEKIGDTINYCILLYACLKEER